MPPWAATLLTGQAELKAGLAELKAGLAELKASMRNLSVTVPMDPISPFPGFHPPHTTPAAAAPALFFQRLSRSLPL